VKDQAYYKSGIMSPEYQRIVEKGLWDKELIDQVMKYGRIEETSAVYLSKLRKEE